MGSLNFKCGFYALMPSENRTVPYVRLPFNSDNHLRRVRVSFNKKTAPYENSRFST